MDRILYATRARQAVIAILRSEHRLFTAVELHDRVTSIHPGLAMSTIYRTLDLLEGLGAVSRHAIGERETGFVYCDDVHHHHAVCRECGHVDDVACPSLDALRASLAETCGFQVDDHTIQFYGRCERCRIGDTRC